MGNKVGVITYWGIYNIGSYLQAFALQHVLKQIGYEPCIIQVQDKGMLAKMKSKSGLLLKLLLYPSYIPKFLELRRMGLRTISDVSSIAKRKFEENQRLVNVIQSSTEELRHFARTDEFVAFICGSDQIWNPLGFEFRGYKYLDFAPKNKRVAYAPSFGISYVPAYNTMQVKKGLNNMRSISVREKEGAMIVEQMIGKKPPVVLDPTLLLRKEDWERWETIINIPDDYMVCFFLSEPGADVLTEIERLGKRKKVVCFPKSYGIESRCDAQILSVGPLEFLYVIHHASVVCTDSFHGVALSSVYEKPIVVFKRSHKGEYNQFSRIENLLELTNNTKCVFGSDSYNGPSSSDNKRIQIEREESMEYLTKAIKNE